VRVWVHFYTRNSNLNLIRVKSGLGVGFIFHLWVQSKHKKTETPKDPKLKRNKKIETRHKPETPPKNPKNPERNQFTKPDGHLNPTRNPMDSGAKFYPWVQIHVSNLT
jgi:hypothetical protein